MTIKARLIKPLTSRKVRVALATVFAAYLSEAGLNVPTDIVLSIVGVGVSLILGIAHEDNGRHANANGNVLADEPPVAPGAGSSQSHGG